MDWPVATVVIVAILGFVVMIMTLAEAFPWQTERVYCEHCEHCPHCEEEDEDFD